MDIIIRMRFYRWFLVGRYKLKQQIKNKIKHHVPLKIILGSGNTTYDSWISTDLPHFDILREKDWAYFFSENTIDNLLAEHVLEHLTEEDVALVLNLSYKYLKNGGCFRIAVPDKNNPDEKYIEEVKPTGKNAKWGHLSFWNFKDFLKLKESKKYDIYFVEYFNDEKKFISKNYTNKNGTVQRRTNNGKEPSLIIDLIKTI